MTQQAVETVGQRLHPLTPFVKGWGYFVVAAFALVNNEGLRQNLTFAGIGLAAVLVGGILLGTLSWWFTKWQLTDDAIRVDSGFLFRRTRIIRFDRIQAIDVAQPFVARLFGMAELSLKTIGEHFGGRDHTTVIHSCQTVRDLMDTDTGFKDNVMELQQKLQLASM